MGRRPSVNLNLPPRMRARRRGDTTYYYLDTLGKPRKEIALGTDYVAAIQKWSELQVREAPVKITVAWAIGQYRASPGFAALAGGTQLDYGYALDKIAEFFGTAPLDEVRPSHITSYIEMRTAGTDTLKGSRHRALRETTVMGRLFRYARAHDWTKNDPISPVERGRLPGRQDVYIHDETVDAVYGHAGIPLRETMDLAYLLGQRPIDVLALTLTSLRDGAVELRQTKRGAPIRVAIAGDLAMLLEAILARRAALEPLHDVLLVDERGNPMTKARLRRRFEIARSAAGIAGADFQFRDLRAKAATDLRDAVNIEASQALLGHRSLAMTEHYTRQRRGKIISAIPKKANKIKGP